MPQISKVLQIGDVKRPESLEKNLYKIKNPYDLTNDIVTKSLNLLQSITGYDYRNNPILDLIERVVDAKNSELVVIGGQRLLVEFGRRAGNNVLNKFIDTSVNLVSDSKPILKNKFKKKDASITDPTKNPNRDFADKVLENFVGYRDNDNYLLTEYGNDNTKFSDINYKYSGDMVKEKILQLNKNSVFSTYNVKTTSKIEFKDQSLIFKNTYSEGFVNQNPDNGEGLYIKPNTITDTYIKGYFKAYPIEKDKLTKDYLLETEDLEFAQGFGYLNKTIARELNTDTIQIQKVQSAEVNRLREVAGEGENSEGTAETFRYDSNTSGQNLLNEKFGVRRGLVYFTSKLSKEDNSTINHNLKQLYKYNEGNDNAIYWKGNGACRTFTVYDQYDNFNRVIKFDGNNEKNSVLRDSVLPKIAPVIGDDINDKHRYFFTMENLAVKPARYDKTNDSEDCDLGPNGGKWMWFVPYNVKLSDNNTVNWADMNFLGRPEPVFSYQNTTRSLSLSFSLLIDTVKNIQDVSPTIQNYYNYLYACNTVDYDYDDRGIEPEPTPRKVQPRKRKPQPVFFKQKSVYYFKNDFYGVNTQNIDYTSGDSGQELDEDQPNNPGISEPYKFIRPEQIPPYNQAPLSSLTYNNNFLKDFTAATQFIFDNYDKVESFKIDIEGYASELFRRNGNSLSDKYNSDLGYRRAYGMMQTMIKYINDNSSGKIILAVPFPDYLENKPFNKTLAYQFKTDKVTFDFNLKSKGSSKASGNSSFANRNEIDEVQDRRVELSLITGYMKPSEDTNPNPAKTTTEKDTLNKNDAAPKPGSPCDPLLTLNFEEIKKENKFPVGFEKLNTFTPSFNSQTPFDFTKRYVFLHQLTRPSKLNNITSVENTVFGRMPVFIIRYGDFIYSKAIARSINFDISEATWDLNPEGMGAIPLMCNVTMDLTLLGGQSLAGPIDRIQTANDSSFIANTSFNSGRYENNKRFTSSRRQERRQYPKRSSGEDKTSQKIITNVNDTATVVPAVVQTPLEERGTPTPTVDPSELIFDTVDPNELIFDEPFAGPPIPPFIKIDQQAKAAQKQKEDEAEEARKNSMQSPVRINPRIGF